MSDTSIVGGHKWESLDFGIKPRVIVAENMRDALMCTMCT